jgi:hypothetical protein
MAIYLALAVWAWGDVSDFFSHPARLGLVIGSGILAVVARSLVIRP